MEPELEVLCQNQEEISKSKFSPKDLKKPYILKPLLIVNTVMFFQQTSGINAVIFNLNDIFAVSNCLGGGVCESVLSYLRVGMVRT